VEVWEMLARKDKAVVMLEFPQWQLAQGNHNGTHKAEASGN
jgi:hypothetical protein